MGLFSKKTDAEIIAEARALYIKGDLSGADLKLIKLAQKGNPDACYLSAKIQLEQAEKKNRELYMKSAKINLEKAVAAGHKEAAELMSKRFGVPKAKNEEQNTSALDEGTKKEAHADVEPEIKEKAEARIKLEEVKTESDYVPEKMSINEETISRDVCVHKEDSVVRDISETERWYETVPVISVNQLSDYDINALFKLATEYSAMGAKEARQMLYSASEIVGIGFYEERSFELIDEDGNTFEIKNTDLDLASMISLVEAIFVDYFEIDEDLDGYYEKILYHDWGLTDNVIKRLLEAMEEFLGVESGKLKCLPFFEELNLGDFIVLVALLILPVEKGFAEVFNHIEQLESCQKNEEPNAVKEEKTISG